MVSYISKAFITTEARWFPVHLQTVAARGGDGDLLDSRAAGGQRRVRDEWMTGLEVGKGKMFRMSLGSFIVFNLIRQNNVKHIIYIYIYITKLYVCIYIHTTIYIYDYICIYKLSPRVLGLAVLYRASNQSTVVLPPTHIPLVFSGSNC